jgi:transketolase
LRLNLAANIPGEIDDFAPWRRIKHGSGCIVIGMGPVLQNLYELDQDLLEQLEIWSVGVLPINEIPAELSASIRGKRPVVVLEEHYGACGLGEALSYLFLTRGVVPQSLTGIHAHGYPSGRYGSQRWHQLENGLAGPTLTSRLEEIVRG